MQLKERLEKVKNKIYMCTNTALHVVCMLTMSVCCCAHEAAVPCHSGVKNSPQESSAKQGGAAQAVL